MAEAGPSSAAELTPEELTKADEMYKEGKALLFEEPERAVDLLGAVLKTRVKQYGGEAIQCADTYLQYGTALYEQARIGYDVFGEKLATSADQQEMNRDSKTENADPNASSLPRTSSAPGAAAPAAPLAPRQQGQQSMLGEEVKPQGALCSPLCTSLFGHFSSGACCVQSIKCLL
jgi:hypothetical protein